MRITDIEIKNFRAFRGTYHIDLSRSGKNLIIYGENGSGKSSLYLALKLFLESGIDEGNKNTEFENHQNIFTEDPGHIKLCLRADRRSEPNVYKWSQHTIVKSENKFTLVARSRGWVTQPLRFHHVCK